MLPVACELSSADAQHVLPVVRMAARLRHNRHCLIAPRLLGQVWAADVTLWELNVGEGKVGEAWAWPTSQLQLAAFTLLLLGTIIYAQVQPFRSGQLCSGLGGLSACLLSCAAHLDATTWRQDQPAWHIMTCYLIMCLTLTWLLTGLASLHDANHKYHPCDVVYHAGAAHAGLSD